MSYLTVLLQGCYRVLDRCKKTYFTAIYELCRAPEPPYRADATTSIRRPQPPAGAAASVCALAHPCAAERRLTVTGPCVHRRLHTSISCPFQVIQSGSHRNFIRNFVYARMAPLDQCGSIVHHPSPANDLFKRIWQEHTRRLHYLVTTPGCRG